MKWGLALLGTLLLASAAGTFFFSLREKAEGICQAAHELAAHAETVSRLVKEAHANPFLGPGALRGPPNSVLAYYRDQARWIAREPARYLLPAAPLEAFRALSEARSDGPELAPLLSRLPAAASGLTCRRPDPTGAPGAVHDPRAPGASALDALVTAAELFWADRQAVVVVEVQEFARDREIYCRTEKLLNLLERVAAAAAEACEPGANGVAALPGAGVARAHRPAGCSHPGAPGGIGAEIKDLKQQKLFNEGKLRQKWPEAVLTGLQC